MDDMNVEPDSEPYREQLEACRHCAGDLAAGGSKRPPVRCLLCERYFEKGRLFLNNVG